MALKETIVEALGYQVNEPAESIEGFSAALTHEERASILPPSRTAVIGVTPTEALKLVPVTRCISVIETAMIQIPLIVKRGMDEIPNPTWIDTPDVLNNVTQAEFMGQTTINLATYGNAFWLITRGQRGISNLQVLKNEDVAVYEDAQENIIYSYKGRTISGDRIKHLKLWSYPGDMLGVGPLQRHKDTLKAAVDLNNYFSQWFDKNSIPSGIVSVNMQLPTDSLTAYKKAFIEAQGQHEPVVLSGGIDYKHIALDPAQAQFLENQKFVARQISTMFGVPSQYLGMSIENTGMAYSNTNTDRQKLYEDGLQPYIIRIEQALSDLLPRGQYAEFNLTSFLRPEDKTRYEGYKLAIESGFLTVNEIRKFEGLPELTPAEQEAMQPTQVIQSEQGVNNDNTSN
jgi:HK97 family phage portal protein